METKMFLLSAYSNNGVSYKVGRRLVSSETHSRQSSADSNKPSMSRAGGSEDDVKKGLILRVFGDKDKFELTPFGQDLDKKSGGKLVRYVDQLTKDFKVGAATLVSAVDPYEAVALSCCGPKDAAVNDKEAIDEKKENVRSCHAGGLKALQSTSINLTPDYETLEDDVLIDANEGYYLSKWRPAKKFTPVTPKGCETVNAQNWARYLSQMPANQMAPKGVVQEAVDQLCKLDVRVKGYNKEDIEAKKMSAFLAVAQGSSAPPMLLECEYIGKIGAPPVLIVAKGVTFDSGGLCLKKPEDMLKHGGMTGAAVALGTMMGVAALKAAVNLLVLVPLCENMISGQCLKVGDVVPTLQGVNVKVEDTDLEGHLMLADALTYGQAQYKPKYVIDVASLTPGMATATGGACYGCFTKNEDLWKIARDAGIRSGDRPWRFPIWDYYGKQITGDTPLFKLQNRGSGLASHCIGAAFLQKFVSGDNWLHYDITGVGKMPPGKTPIYLDPNLMTGRPTRALINAVIGMGAK